MPGAMGMPPGPTIIPGAIGMPGNICPGQGATGNGQQVNWL